MKKVLIRILCVVSASILTGVSQADSVSLLKIGTSATYVDIDVTGSPSFGGSSAQGEVNVVDFKAFDCPPCKALEYNNSVAVRKHFENDPRVRFIFKMGKLRAPDAPKHAFCAHSQGRFEDVKKYLFNSPFANSQSVKNALQFSTGSNEAVNYDACISSSTPSAFLARELADVSKVGLASYPTMFIDGKYFDLQKNASDLSSKIIAAIEKALND